MNDENRRPLIIAHRGASANAPENTLAAFRLAVEMGADGVEFDVRLARDGVPVVIHDASLKRTAGVRANVEHLTSEELAAIDVGSWFGLHSGAVEQGRYSGERVPTLAATLTSLSAFEGIIFIELKSAFGEIEPLAAAVCRVVNEASIAGRVIVKSFKLAAIPHVRMLAPGVRTAALFAPRIMSMLRKEKHLVMIAEEFGADELSIHYSLATRKLMEKADKHGLPVNIWTADNPRWVKRGTKLGLRSIITNDPLTLLGRREELARESEAGA